MTCSLLDLSGQYSSRSALFTLDIGRDYATLFTILQLSEGSPKASLTSIHLSRMQGHPQLPCWPGRKRQRYRLISALFRQFIQETFATLKAKRE